MSPLPTALAALALALTAGCAQSSPAAKTATIDVMNSQCLVMPGEQTGDETVTYQGKIYHFCCSSCVAIFKKNPEKYVRAYNANPAAYDAK